jgi:hypothetical protein
MKRNTAIGKSSRYETRKWKHALKIWLWMGTKHSDGQEFEIRAPEVERRLEDMALDGDEA